MEDYDPKDEDHDDKVPPWTKEEDDMYEGTSSLVEDLGELHKYGSDGRRLQTDSFGTALQRREDYRPEGCPEQQWKNYTKEEEEVHRQANPSKYG